jgi:hypothetical protein
MADRGLDDIQLPGRFPCDHGFYAAVNVYTFMESILGRDTSSLGTVVGATVFVVAVIGGVFLDWFWNDPELAIPVLIGAGAAVAAVWFTLQSLRG